MSNLQVKNVPESLHRDIHRQARRQGRTVRDLVLEAVQRYLSREDLLARLAEREPIELGKATEHALQKEREERDEALTCAS